MDHKSLKSDLTYFIKKSDKKLSAFDGNLEILENNFKCLSDELDPLEMFILGKGYLPSKELLNSQKGYSFSLVEFLSKETEISKNDFYSFLDGYDNIETTSKNDFYNVGVYIREKFSPYNARKSTLKNTGFAFEDKTNLVKKFIVSLKKNEIIEAECQVLVNTKQLQEGEYFVRVLSPRLLFEKKADGTMGPSVIFSRFVYDSEEKAKNHMKQFIKDNFEANKNNNNIDYSLEELDRKFIEIKTIRL